MATPLTIDRAHSLRGAPPWMPYSPCAVGCLAAGPGAATVSTPVAVVRLAGLVLVLASAVPLAIAYPLLGAGARAAVVARCCWLMLRAVGVTLRLEAAPAAGRGPALVVANHISWLDVLVLGAVRPGRMVARADLRGWPVVGPVAARAGAIFVDRSRLSLLPRAVAEAGAALRGGATVIAFPEGTTWCGAPGGPFRPALFQAAVDAGVPIEPVSVRYLAGGAPSTAPAFVGDDSLVGSVWRVARASGLSAVVRQHPPLPSDAGRRALAGEVGRLVHGSGRPAHRVAVTGGVNDTLR